MSITHHKRMYNSIPMPLYSQATIDNSAEQTIVSANPVVSYFEVH